MTGFFGSIAGQAGMNDDVDFTAQTGALIRFVPRLTSCLQFRVIFVLKNWL